MSAIIDVKGQLQVKVMMDPYFYGKRQQEILDGHIAETKDLIKKRLKAIREDELKNIPGFEDMIISIEICEGFPAEEILSKADELNCDAIIMGTHSKGIIANTFLGSTAKRVLRRTRKPVFIIPLPKEEIDITSHQRYLVIHRKGAECAKVKNKKKHLCVLLACPVLRKRYGTQL